MGLLTEKEEWIKMVNDLNKMLDCIDSNLSALPKRKRFSNSSIKPFREGKPHICLRDDYWRVSKMPKYLTISYKESTLYTKAHCFVNTLNAERFDL